MTTKDPPGPFNQEERAHYRNLVALFINKSQTAKKRLDGHARTQLASVRETLPDADKETIVTFLLSMAFLMSKVLTTPVSDVAELGHAVFQHNVTAAASVMGIYDLDDPEDMPVYVPPAEDGDGEEPPPDIQRKIDDIIQRQYL